MRRLFVLWVVAIRCVGAWSPPRVPRLPRTLKSTASPRNRRSSNGAPPLEFPLDGPAPFEALGEALGEGSLLRDVDEDSELWQSLDALPVVANPLLAAVEPERAAEEDPDALTRKKIRTTALPLFCVWLASPTLSLIDTAVVGRFAAGALPMAALSPAVSFADSLSYMMSFLAIVTTNKVATAVAEKDMRAGRAATRDGVLACLAVGVLLGAACELGLGAAVLRHVYVTPATARVLPLATRYVRIRNAAFPAQLAWQTAQAASVARGDVGAPLRATALAAGVNVVFDVLFVAVLGWGVEGAAAATALATFAGCGAQLAAVRRTHRNERVAEAVASVDGVYAPSEIRPSAASFRALWADAAPFFLTLFSKTVVGVVLTAAAAGAGVLALAAQQIVYGLFCFVCPFADALASAAQALVPRALLRARQRKRDALKIVLAEGARSAAASGAVAAALAVVGAPLFTADARVLRACGSLAAPLGLSLALYIFNTVFEGTLFAFGHQKPIGLVMPANALAVVAVFLSPAVRGSPHAITRAWWCFVAYQVVRIPQLALIARGRGPDAEPRVA